jgi:hypothetical protein
MNALVDMLNAKREWLLETLTERASLLLPVALFLLLMIATGGLEGNAWRRGRLYAGYYRLIFLSSLVWFVSLVLSAAVWLLLPHLCSVRTLTLVLSWPALALGWTLTAGRPVLR